MRKSIIIAISTVGLACLSGQASAQDAAESAAVMGATGPSTGKAQRSLGGAISGSLNSAASTIRSSGRGGARPARRGGSVRVSRQGLPAGVDALEGTDASAYRLDNGVTIKISGRMNPSAQARCVKECGAVKVQQRPAAEAPDAKPAAAKPDLPKD